MNDFRTNVEIRSKDEIDVFSLIQFYFSKILYFFILFILGSILAFLVTWKCVTPKYTAIAKMYMVSSSTKSVVDLTDLNIGTSLSLDYVELIQTRPIFETVKDKLSLPYEYEEFLKMIKIKTIEGTRILSISVTSNDQVEAKEIADELCKLTITELPKLMGTSKPSVAENPIVPEKKSSPSYVLNTFLGGLIFSLVYAFWLLFKFLSEDLSVVSKENAEVLTASTIFIKDVESDQ